MVIAKGYNSDSKPIKREKTLYIRNGNVRRTIKYKIFVFYANNSGGYNVLGFYCKTFNQNIIKASFFDEKGVYYIIFNNALVSTKKLVNYKIPKIK